MWNYNVIPINGRAIADSRYELPSEEWVTDKYPDILFNFLRDLKQGSWVSESNDCDDFSKISASFAHVLHHNTPRKQPNTGLAFGEFYYNINGDPTKGHAINFALAKTKDNKVKLVFFEPQEFKVITLTKEEIASCQNWLL